MGEIWSIVVGTGSFLALCTAEEGLERAPMVLSGGMIALVVRIGDPSWRAEQSEVTEGVCLL